MTTIKLPDDFDEVLRGFGYLAPQRIDDQHWCAISPNFIYTVAIVEGDARDLTTGYSKRWCYHDLTKATVALAEWKSRGFDHKPINYITEKG